jgi:hypothetical protein
MKKILAYPLGSILSHFAILVKLPSVIYFYLFMSFINFLELPEPTLSGRSGLG